MRKIKLILEYLSEFENIFKFIVIYELMELLVILGSVVYFMVVYSNCLTASQLSVYVKKLPGVNKIFFIWFTLFYAIPNKIWVNNKISPFGVVFLIFLVIAFSSVFPVLILLYILFWVTVLESYFFAVLYEDNVSFRKFVDNILFKNDTIFAKEYFNFFWGNMNSGGAGKGKAGVVGTILGGLYKVGRGHEQTHVREQAGKEMKQHIENAQEKPKTAEESLALQKKVEDHVVDRDTIILKGEKQLKHLSEKAVNWWNNG